MSLKLLSKQVGPWPMNTYAVVCEESHNSAIFDPGADANEILNLIEGTQVDKILLTHGHPDHVGALEDVKKATGALVYIHPADSDKYDIDYDVSLEGLDRIRVGKQHIHTFHTPGHTPGQTCFDIGNHRIIVGDTLFVNGPGHTDTPDDFATTIKTIQKVVFSWLDETEFFPGHGPSGRLGNERPAIEVFIKKGWPPDLHGDVTWK